MVIDTHGTMGTGMGRRSLGRLVRGVFIFHMDEWTNGNAWNNDTLYSGYTLWEKKIMFSVFPPLPLKHWSTPLAVMYEDRVLG